MPRTKKPAPTIDLNLVDVYRDFSSPHVDRTNVQNFLKALLPSRCIQLPSPQPDPDKYPSREQRMEVLAKAAWLYDDLDELLHDAKGLWAAYHKDRAPKTGTSQPLIYRCFGAIWKILLLDRADLIPFWRAYFSGAPISVAQLGSTRGLAKLVEDELYKPDDPFSRISRRSSEDYVKRWKQHVVSGRPDCRWDHAHRYGFTYIVASLPWLSDRPCRLLMSASATPDSTVLTLESAQTLTVTD